MLTEDRMDTTLTSDTSLGSYSLFTSIGSEPRHLWPKAKTKHKMQSNCDQRSDSLDQLFVFGYSCKLFRDDQRAQEIDSGRHLIGWNGSTDHLIDRFDVRGYLNDLSPFEATHKGCPQELSAEELEIEKVCDIERYSDLTYDDFDQEEEMKRLHIALADGTAYNQMSYNYEQNIVDSNQCTNECPVSELIAKIDDSDKFKLPSGLSPPEEIQLPESQKLHNIIEKTALFVSKHGIQMEIVLKTKQSSNKNFDFLSFDSQLYSYYQYLLKAIKSGKYVPKQTESCDNSESDDSDDDHYLHPSLLGSAKTRESNVFKIPSLLQAPNTDDTYSQLVKSLKDILPVIEETVETAKPLPVQQTDPISTESELIKNNSNNTDNNVLKNALQSMRSSLLPSPPPEIEKIIEKLAQRVSTNGEKFEQSIRKLDEKRFDFVNPGHIYHAHYIRRKMHYLEEHRKAQVSKHRSNHKKYSKSDSQTLKIPVSFSISSKESKPSAQTTSPDENLSTVSSKREDERNCDPEITAKRMSDNALKDKLALAVRERAAKDKQEERKRKAAMFLSLIKSKSKEQTKNDSNVCQNTSNTFGPDLQKSKPGSAPLSPTTVAVTSPNASPLRDDRSSLSLKNFETAKSGSLLPFIVKDKPLKESSGRLSPHRQHKSRRSSSSKKSHKRKRSKSRSTSGSPSRSHRKHTKHSKSRSRSGSHSRHKRHNI